MPAPDGDQGVPAFPDDGVGVEPLGGGGCGEWSAGHEVGDLRVVREVAGRGCLAQPANGGGQVVLLAARGVVKGQGGLQDRDEPGQTRDLDPGPQHGGAIEDVAIGAGVADQGGHLEVEDRRALVQWLKELVGEGDLVFRPVRVGEGRGQGEAGLGDGPLTLGVVLFGLAPGVLEGSDGRTEVSLRPVDVAQDTVVAALPAQVGDGGQCGGEVAADAGEVGHAAARPRGQPSLGLGNLAHTSEGVGGAADVLVCLGPVVPGELGQFLGQQAGRQDSGQALRRTRTTDRPL